MLTVALLIGAAAHAADAETLVEEELEFLVTDRPGNGNAAAVVPPARLQFELGTLYALQRDQQVCQGDPTFPGNCTTTDVHQVAFPVALRFGVFEWLELRGITGVMGIETQAGETQVEPTDTAGGLKLGILTLDGWVPDLALMADVFFATGRGAFTGGATVPDMRAAVAWVLPARFGLFGNLGADVPEDAAGRYGRFLWVFQVNYAIPLDDQLLVLFAEGYGRASFSERDEFTQVDFGLAWVLNPDLQVDFFTQHGLFGETPDLQLSLGVSIRV